VCYNQNGFLYLDKGGDATEESPEGCSSTLRPKGDMHLLESKTGKHMNITLSPNRKEGVCFVTCFYGDWEDLFRRK
jgi:hypothetical protein